MGVPPKLTLERKRFPDLQEPFFSSLRSTPSDDFDEQCGSLKVRERSRDSGSADLDTPISVSPQHNRAVPQTSYVDVTTNKPVPPPRTKIITRTSRTQSLTLPHDLEIYSNVTSKPSESSQAINRTEVSRHESLNRKGGFNDKKSVRVGLPLRARAADEVHDYSEIYTPSKEKARVPWQSEDHIGWSGHMSDETGSISSDIRPPTPPLHRFPSWESRIYRVASQGLASERAVSDVSSNLSSGNNNQTHNYHKGNTGYCSINVPVYTSVKGVSHFYSSFMINT